MKKIIVVLLMGLFIFGVSACGNDEYEETLESGYEKYINGEEMSEEEYNAVKSFKDWEDKQTPKSYNDWDE